MTLVPQSVGETESLQDVLKALSGPQSEQRRPETPPRTIPVPGEALRALETLAEDLALTVYPATRRKLGPSEAYRYSSLLRNIKLAEKTFDKARDAIKTSVFNHLDIEVEEAEVEAAVDAKGHYLVTGSIGALNREIRQGAPSVEIEGLQALLDKGKITRGQYLKMTRKPDVPRVVDEEGVLAALKKDPSLLNVLGGAIVPGKTTAALTVGK